MVYVMLEFRDLAATAILGFSCKLNSFHSC